MTNDPVMAIPIDKIYEVRVKVRVAGKFYYDDYEETRTIGRFWNKEMADLFAEGRKENPYPWDLNCPYVVEEEVK